MPHSPLTPTRPGLQSQPIAYGICADFSLGKQQFFEKHEGVKILSWSTSKDKSRMLLPSVPGAPKSPSTTPLSRMTSSSSGGDMASSSDAPLDPPGLQRVRSGTQPSAPVAGGWYSGLEVYLFRILTETSMSVGWGKMLRNKRVSVVVCHRVFSSLRFCVNPLSTPAHLFSLPCMVTLQQGPHGRADASCRVNQRDSAQQAHRSREPGRWSASDRP